MIFLPILGPGGPEPDPHLRVPLFEDMAHFSLRSMNRGFPLHMSDKSTKASIPGRFVRTDGEELAVEGTLQFAGRVCSRPGRMTHNVSWILRYKSYVFSWAINARPYEGSSMVLHGKRHRPGPSLPHELVI